MMYSQSFTGTSSILWHLFGLDLIQLWMFSEIKARRNHHGWVWVQHILQLLVWVICGPASPAQRLQRLQLGKGLKEKFNYQPSLVKDPNIIGTAYFDQMFINLMILWNETREKWRNGRGFGVCYGTTFLHSIFHTHCHHLMYVSSTLVIQPSFIPAPFFTHHPFWVFTIHAFKLGSVKASC